MMVTPVLLLTPTTILLASWACCVLGLVLVTTGRVTTVLFSWCLSRCVAYDAPFPAYIPHSSVQWIYMFTRFKKWKAELRLCRSCTASRWQHRFSPGSPPALPFPAAALCPLPLSPDAFTLTQFLRV